MPRSRRRKPRSRAANVARLEHAELWEKYWRFRSVEDRNALVEALLPWTIGLTRKALGRALYGRRPAERPPGLGLTDDERSVVAIGLINVVERYDPLLASLGTYMWWNTRGIVLELWRKQGWFPKRWCSDGTYARRGRAISMLSLDEMREDRENTSSAQYSDDWLPDVLVDQEGMREIEDAVSTRDECLSYLSMLSGQDELVIRLRYVEDMQFKIIAERMGVTRQRVCFIHKRAISRLRILIEKELK